MPQNKPRIRYRERIRPQSSPGKDEPSSVPSDVAPLDPPSAAASRAEPRERTARASSAGRTARSYEVGFGKPPVATQFQPGRSGNPKGRPKKHFTIAGAIAAELNAKHPITINGRATQMTQAQIVAKQLFKKAMAGDQKAIALIMKHEPTLLGDVLATTSRASMGLKKGKDAMHDNAGLDTPLSATDREMMTWFLEANEDGAGDETDLALTKTDDGRSFDGLGNAGIEDGVEVDDTSWVEKDVA